MALNGIDRHDILQELDEEAQRVRRLTGREELILADVKRIPSVLVPKHGGLNAYKIAAWGELAYEVGVPEAWAWIKGVNQVGMLQYAEFDEFLTGFHDSYCGVQDSLTEWAWADIEGGGYSHALMTMAKEHPSYIDIDAVRRDMEMNSYYVHIHQNGSVYRFVGDDLLP